MAQRFPPLESSVNEFIADQENKNTRAKTERDVKLLKAFLTVKGESRKPEELTPQELNENLSEFILSVKRKDGEDYEPSSLRGLLRVLTDISRSRNTLEASLKALDLNKPGNAWKLAVNNWRNKEKPATNLMQRKLWRMMR